MLPPPAPLPEVSPAIDEAYSKKHDRPPARTNRYEDDATAPHYSEGEPGPSVLSGAPPPFDEREAPPPFFATEFEASTSSRLPTFQEAENNIILPEPGDNATSLPPVAPTIPGEGTVFGFSSSQQFDGHAEDMQRSNTPPPTLEMASHDTNLTSFADLHDSGHVTIETLNLVLESHSDNVLDQEQPPPPPAMDDPSDPPPSIDSAFRAPDSSSSTYRTTDLPPSIGSYRVDLPPPSIDSYRGSDPPPSIDSEFTIPPGHPPTIGSQYRISESIDQRASTPPLPPYLVPDHHHHHQNHEEHVNRPPPYVD